LWFLLIDQQFFLEKQHQQILCHFILLPNNFPQMCGSREKSRLENDAGLMNFLDFASRVMPL